MFSYLHKILYILSGTRKKLIFLVCIFVFSSLLEALGIGLIAPFLKIAANPELIYKIPLLKLIYLSLKLENSNQFIPIMGVLMIAVFSIKSTLYFFGKAYTVNFSFNQKKRLISRLMNGYLKVPYTFHLSRNSATIIKNTVIETNQFTQYCLLPSLNATASLIVLVVLLLLLAKTKLLLLGMTLGILLPTFILFNKLGKKFRRWGEIKSKSQKEMIRILNHGLGGIKETRIIGCESYFEQQMEDEASKFAKAATLFQSLQLLPKVVIENTLIILLVLFISISQIYLKDSVQELTAVLGVFAIASVRLISSATLVIQSLGHMRNTSYILNMLYFDLKEIEKEKANDLKTKRYFGTRTNSKIVSNGKSQLIDFNKIVELKDVTYKYPGIEEPAIQKVSLKIEKGQSVALIGKSGAGKTTLADIILGLLEPQSGDILVDGVSIYTNLRSWQNFIGYIPQSIFLIDDTIERNIAFGVPDKTIDKTKLKNAIEAAQLTELIEQLPNGLKTEVGERGIRLSGGQRQRIGIARSLYHEREILVLDEATSALDNETESLVSEAIRNLAGTKTLIIIAHRLSTVEHCDLVYLLEKGRVVRSGNYQEVVIGK
jgi:ABC-type multidrug transport system fused ATPase/permease subunit